MVLNVCDVCRLLNGDITPKHCGYCPDCDAWICLKHESDWISRLRAAWRRIKEPGWRGNPDYIPGLLKKLGFKIVDIARMRDQIESGAQRLNGG